MIVLPDLKVTLVDREALCLLTGRSEHTIRLRLRPAQQHRHHGALYDLDASVERLSHIPTRKRAHSNGGQTGEER